MKHILFLILILSFSNFNFAQSNVEQLVLEKVNALRDSLHLPKLKYDRLLSEAGKDQAFYMIGKKKLTHFQKTFTKETPAARVEYYKGNRTYVGENVAKVPIPYFKKDSMDESKLAQSLFDSWFNSPPHYKNMIHPNFTKMGLSTVAANKKQMYAAQVFSSNEITLPKAFKNPERSWGVRPSEFSCKDEKTRYETMFFANSIVVEGDSVYFYFHDLKFFRNVINSDNDGLALDIILREQLPCDKENQFHISTIYDGEMQRPIYKYDIYRKDESNNPKKIKIKLGVVPDHLKNKQWEPNIIIINDNKLCDYSYPVEVPSAIFPLLKLKPYFDTNDSINMPSSSLVSKITDSIHVELMYQRSQKRFNSLDLDEFMRLLSWSQFINKVNVDCFASVEGATWFNTRLLEDRTKSVSNLLKTNGFDLNRVHITSAENWVEMNAQIQQVSLENLKHKTKSQIKYFLKKNKTERLDSLLFNQRKTHIYATVDTTLELTNYTQYKFASYYDSTLNINLLPLNKILREDYILANNEIEVSLIDLLKNKTELKTNLLGAAAIKQVNGYLDSNTVIQLLSKLDHSNSEQVFNFSHFLTKYWFSHFSNSYETKGVAETITPDELLNLISTLDTIKVKSKDIDRLNVNVLLAGIHYYVAHNNWQPVDDYFNTIAELVKLDNFTAEEARELALFCNHFHKFKVAVKILHPFHENKSLSENGYFVLAKTSTLIRTKLEQTDYRNYMASAKKVNHSRYCSWLDKAFQIQRDEFIKKDFCESCQ